MELYAILVAMLGTVETHDLCENLFWTPHSQNEKVIEACEENVWKNSFPNSYINNK